MKKVTKTGEVHGKNQGNIQISGQKIKSTLWQRNGRQNPSKSVSDLKMVK